MIEGACECWLLSLYPVSWSRSPRRTCRTLSKNVTGLGALSLAPPRDKPGTLRLDIVPDALHRAEGVQLQVNRRSSLAAVLFGRRPPPNSRNAAV